MDRRLTRKMLAAALLGAALVGSACSAPTPQTASTASQSSPTSSSSATGTPAPSSSSYDPKGPPIVLALGDSLAAGYLPTGAEERKASYAGLLTERLAQGIPGLGMDNLACTGETAQSFADGGKCPYDEGSQLAQARKILAQAGPAVRLVTLDIGANDVLTCLRSSCQTKPQVRTQVSEILGALRAAAPQTPIALVNYYNPLVIAGTEVPTETQKSLAAQWKTLNSDLSAAASEHKVTLVDLTSAFHLGDTTPVRVGTQEMTQEGATLCALTYVCTKRDIHLNPAGHKVVADTAYQQLKDLVAP